MCVCTPISFFPSVLPWCVYSPDIHREERGHCSKSTCLGSVAVPGRCYSLLSEYQPLYCLVLCPICPELAVLWLFSGCSMAVLWLFYVCSLAVVLLFSFCSLAPRGEVEKRKQTSLSKEATSDSHTINLHSAHPFCCDKSSVLVSRANNTVICDCDL